jgi:hypothetical protein
MDFGYKLGTADSGHMEAGYDEAEIAGKLGLFNQTEGFRRIAYALHVIESPFKKGLAKERLEWVVIHQEDSRHGVLDSSGESTGWVHQTAIYMN